MLEGEEMLAAVGVHDVLEAVLVLVALLADEPALPEAACVPEKSVM